MFPCKVIKIKYEQIEYRGETQEIKAPEGWSIIEVFPTEHGGSIMVILGKLENSNALGKSKN
jgi:hypothetical protein